MIRRGRRRSSGGVLAGARGTDRPGLAVVVIMLGTFMVVLDTMMVNVALPEIGRNLVVGPGIEWVVTGNLLAMGVVQPMTGWVADRFGEKGGFLGALALFGASSALAAVAPTFPVLVTARVLQGAFGGLALPLSAALLFAMFPVERRGTAIGLSGTAAMIAPALGPVLSGWIVSNASWRWVMVVNIPVGLIGFLVGMRVVPNTGDRPKRSFDALGLLLIASGLTGLLVGLSYAHAWGWLSPRFLGLMIAALLLLLAFWRQSNRAEHALLDPRILADPIFRITILIVWAFSLAQFARQVFIPVELQVVRGLGPFEAGLVVASAAVLAMVAMPISGRWTDRSGGRPPAMIGLAVLAAAMARLGTLKLETPDWQVVVAVALTGMGIVLVTMPVTVVGLNVIAARLGHRFVGEAAAVRALNRQIAGSVSTMVLAAIVVASIGTLNVTATDHASLVEAQSAYNRVYLASLLGLAVAFLLALRLPGRSEQKALERQEGGAP